MQNTAAVSQLSLFKASEPPAVEQVFKKPRAKPANTWAFRVELPMVREGIAWADAGKLPISQ